MAEQQKFDFKALMNHEIKSTIIFKERNKPNLDLMAEALYKLLQK